ncbi:hypothetical protein E1B28_007868 [Marasmius oreades]|uniref:Uncharacterized protein n=1 Tax=Marasmius oreades TaxID=181124 RepID=A0A9P7UW02_9AGAR|nr:uncharacterized protein E1B28_007868 [Marasmius oreades]KAG7094264.1 hypothetical protein E1B28_007868 [Marasmius oreades]
MMPVYSLKRRRLWASWWLRRDIFGRWFCAHLCPLKRVNSVLHNPVQQSWNDGRFERGQTNFRQRYINRRIRFPNSIVKKVNEAALSKDVLHYFCKILAVAMIKDGVHYELMGIMQGKVIGKTMVMDSSHYQCKDACNARNSAAEYMVQYTTGSERVRRLG